MGKRKQPSQSSQPSPVTALANALLSEELAPVLSTLGISPSALLSPKQDQSAFVASLAQQLEKANFNQLSSDVTQEMLQKYSFVRIETSKTTSNKKDGVDIYRKAPEDLTYMLCSQGELKQELLSMSGRWLDNATQEKLLDTFLSYTPLKQVKERRFMAIGPQLYWDVDKHTIVHAVPKNHYCYIRLFDSEEDSGGGVISFPKESFDETFSKMVENEYNTMLASLRSIDAPATFQDIIDKCPRSFHFIEEWANDDAGLYWDILTLIATVFMKNKPLGAYFLIGLTRNGKSTCVNLLHTIFGTANTSKVRLSALGEPHFAGTLRNSILNAPDDEDDDITKYQGAFKELAGHQTFSAAKLYSQSPMRIKGADITFVFPMNTLPMWKGSSASACSKRTIPIPFLRDFSSSDMQTNNFEQRTFTKDTVGRIAAQAMALATFFNERPEMLGYSETSTAQKKTIAEDNNSVDAYRKAFEKLFCGFQKKDTLYTDYQLWCSQKEYRYGDRKTLQLAFQAYLDTRFRTNKVYSISDTQKISKKCCRSANSNPTAPPLMDDLWIPELKMSVNDLHRNGMSAVYQMQEFYEEMFDGKN